MELFLGFNKMLNICGDVVVLEANGELKQQAAGRGFTLHSARPPWVIRGKRGRVQRRYTELGQRA